MADLKARNLLVRDLFPIPTNPTVTKTRCITLTIPDDIEHEAVFAGALALLQKWNSWQKDGTHNAADCAETWRAALLDGIRACEMVDTNTGVEIEDDMGDNIRLDPDNKCIIQIKCCGEWQTLIDVAACARSSNFQPTDGTPLDAGACREWDAVIPPNGGWLIPVTLSAGDVVVTESIEGAWASNFLDWHCPDGTPFAGGFCVGSPTFSGIDPVPTLAHMRLLLDVGGVLADGYNTTYAVAGGVTDAIGVLKANSDSFIGPSGTIKVHVKVCRPNEVEAPITAIYDYGSGASPVPDSGIFTVLSGCCGGGGAHDWGIGVTFSETVHIEVLGSVGFDGIATPGSGLYETIRPSGGSSTPVSTLTGAESTNPAAIPAANGNYYSISAGSGDLSYQITLRVTRL